MGNVIRSLVFVRIYSIVLGSNYWLGVFCRLSLIIDFLLQTFHFIQSTMKDNFPLCSIITLGVKGVGDLAINDVVSYCNPTSEFCGYF